MHECCLCFYSFPGVDADSVLYQISYRLSWDQIRHLCHCRRHYIQLYMASLQHSPQVNHTEIREIEKDLDPKVILLWRCVSSIMFIGF